MAVETMKVNIHYLRECASVEKQGRFAWVAELTKDGDRYFYSEEGRTIRIAKWQYERVLGNPYAYYFSTALRLHCVCQHNPGLDLTFMTVDGIKEESGETIFVWIASNLKLNALFTATSCAMSRLILMTRS